MATKKVLKPKLNTILLLLILVCAVVVIVLLIKNNSTLAPDYAPGEIDTNAIKEKDDGKKMDVSDGGGAVSLAYSNVVSIDLKTKKAKLYFKNPSKSRENTVLEVIVKQGNKEVVIAKSDLIPTGYALYELNVDKSARLTTGGYNGFFRVTYFDEKTSEKQIVNTEIEITIDVK